MHTCVRQHQLVINCINSYQNITFLLCTEIFHVVLNRFPELSEILPLVTLNYEYIYIHT